MRLHVGDHVGAAARAQRCASATTVANRPHKPRFGSSNTADSPCQFRVPPMRPLPSGTTRTCHDKLVRDLRDATPKRPAARQRSPPPPSRWMRAGGEPPGDEQSQPQVRARRYVGPDQQQSRQSGPRDWPARGNVIHRLSDARLRCGGEGDQSPAAQTSCPHGRRLGTLGHARRAGSRPPSLWPSKPIVPVRLALSTVGSETLLSFTLLTPDALPDSSKAGHLRRRLNKTRAHDAGGNTTDQTEISWPFEVRHTTGEGGEWE